MLAFLVVMPGMEGWVWRDAPVAWGSAAAQVVAPGVIGVLEPSVERNTRYRWIDGAFSSSVASRFRPPFGYARLEVKPGSFGEWLRGLPLEPGRGVVDMFDGTRARNQRNHVAVLAIDVGARDLQQCADAVIRLRAEYLLATGRGSEIAFRFTSGDLARWSDWREGR
ncbi:DUF4846 domain-containing protein [bacterium]|nr:DUF4846 domain-containing protein [bacterium]